MKEDKKQSALLNFVVDGIIMVTIQHRIAHLLRYPYENI